MPVDQIETHLRSILAKVQQGRFDEATEAASILRTQFLRPQINQFNSNQFISVDYRMAGLISYCKGSDSDSCLVWAEGALQAWLTYEAMPEEGSETIGETA
jgi:hypothetical protein